MLSATQLLRMILIPVGMAMFMIAAQLSAGLTLRTSTPPQMVTSSR